MNAKQIKAARTAAAKALAAARWTGSTVESRRASTAAMRAANKRISPATRAKIVAAATAGRRRQAENARAAKISEKLSTPQG